jgi:hypothetical protein
VKHQIRDYAANAASSSGPSLPVDCDANQHPGSPRERRVLLTPAGSPDTRPRFVALAVHPRLVKEHRFIRAETSTNGGDDIPRTRKASLAMSDAAVPLSPVGVKPLANEVEVRTAVVDLVVTIMSGFPAFEDSH